MKPGIRHPRWSHLAPISAFRSPSFFFFFFFLSFFFISGRLLARASYSSYFFLLFFVFLLLHPSFSFVSTFHLSHLLLLLRSLDALVAFDPFLRVPHRFCPVRFCLFSPASRESILRGRLVLFHNHRRIVGLRDCPLCPRVMRLEWLRLLRAETERFWYHGNLLFLGLSPASLSRRADRSSFFGYACWAHTLAKKPASFETWQPSAPENLTLASATSPANPRSERRAIEFASIPTEWSHVVSITLRFIFRSLFSCSFLFFLLSAITRNELLFRSLLRIFSNDRSVTAMFERFNIIFDRNNCQIHCQQWRDF